MYFIIGFITIIALAYFMRMDFRNSLRPFQWVGVKLKGEVVNAKIVSVNNEMQTISILHNKEAIDVSFNNVYMPTWPEEWN
jgi:hypothetical protein